MITVIYLCHNRLDYVKMSLPRIFHECEISTRVKELIIYDDMSTDGTSEYIQSFDYPNTHLRRKYGNSTQQINDTYPKAAKYIFKCDNDILLPYDCFDYMYDLMEIQEKWGFLMMHDIGRWPTFDLNLDARPASHIGGVGMFRTEIFRNLGDVQTNGRFGGFTKYQFKAISQGWQCIRLRNVQTCNLDVSPTYGNSKHYEKVGWGRVTNRKETIFSKHFNNTNGIAH